MTGHRAGGRDWSPLFAVREAEVADEAGGSALRVHARDTTAGLSLLLETELTAAGLVRQRATVTNDDPGEAYTLEGLLLTLPVPRGADEVFDLTGRWARERVPQRRPFTAGAWVRETRRGRPATTRPAPRRRNPGFGFGTGQVWACTWPGAATTGCSPSGCPPGTASWAAGSCCCRARARSRPAPRTGPLDLRRLRRRGARQPLGPLPRPVAGPPHHPRPRARWCSTHGRPSTSTTTWRG
ncbi:glycoside hydrolase family 36 N-terminal domain-containing protein [Streptomyces sp. M19]